MSDEHFDENVLRAYLLGELEGVQQEALETAYLRRPELCAELVALEDELIDELVAGRLSPARGEALERRLRLAPDGDRRLTLARALSQHATVPASISARTAPVQARAVSNPWLATWALAAALLICTVLGTFFLLRARSLERQLIAVRTERETLGRETAELQTRAQALREELERERRTSEALEEHARVRQPESIVRLVLAAGLTRDGRATAEIRLPPTATTLHLLLTLDDEPLPRYTALLQTPEGQTVWQQSELVPRPAGGNHVVVFHVPTERVEPGDYVVLLQGSPAIGAPEAAGEYAFRVQR